MDRWQTMMKLSPSRLTVRTCPLYDLVQPRGETRTLRTDFDAENPSGARLPIRRSSKLSPGVVNSVKRKRKRKLETSRNRKASLGSVLVGECLETLSIFSNGKANVNLSTLATVLSGILFNVLSCSLRIAILAISRTKPRLGNVLIDRQP